MIAQMKAMEEENRGLKRLLADTMLDMSAMRELLAKNVWSAPLLQGFRGWRTGLRKCIRPLISQPLLATRP